MERKEYLKKWYQKNKERLRELFQKRIEKYKNTNTEKYEKYLEARRKAQRIYYQRHKGYYKDYSQNYASHKKRTPISREKNNQKRKEITRQRRHNDPQFRLNDRMSKSIYRCLKGKKRRSHWETLVGYTLMDLRKHLNKNIPKGYSWNDYLSGTLHLDHIIPLAVFNFKSPNDIDFKKAWGLKNLRLLPAKENLKKHSKIEKPFQPSLSFYLT